eukprot:m.151087 g.151087  ORF g.151087 m.151087 type:complete len:492 (+) comp38568_c0_seq2:50-1525(+)
MRPIKWRKRLVIVILLVMLISSWLTFSWFGKWGIPAKRGAKEETPSVHREVQSVLQSRDLEPHVAERERQSIVEKQKTENIPVTDKSVERGEQQKRKQKMTAQNNSILEKVLLVNEMERVWNEDRFPNPLLNDRPVIFAVQVHSRADYFKYLIESLRSVKGIEQALVIVSHDFYSSEMNKTVQSIDFCRVVQIFYPFSMQFYPDKFPGADPNDCPRDISKNEAIQKKCNNAENPDQYGHYREAKFTMTKHHWWWKISHIFDGMKLTRNFNGYVLFLEEDHFLSPDLLYTLNKIASVKSSACPSCDFIGLGVYDKVTDFSGLGASIQALAWVSGKHNMGFAMNRNTWNTVKSCSKIFCTFDDYNWDWTLQSLGRRCLSRPLSVLTVRSPKVFHIGQCGVHHKSKGMATQCDASSIVARFRDVLQRNAAVLFPKELVNSGASHVQSFAAMTDKGYGGWGDIRDHQLCLSYTEKNPENILNELGSYLKFKLIDY